MKRTFRRIAGFFLAVCLVFGCMATAFAADIEDEQAGGAYRFSDIADHYARNSIEAFAEADYIQGYENGTFKPDADITRQEFAVIIGRILGIGYEAADADPQQAEADAAMLAEMFSDAGEIGDYAVGYMAAVVKAGYMQGRSGLESGTIAPGDTITRQEAFAMISRILGIGYEADDAAEGQLESDAAMLEEKFTDGADVDRWAVGYAAAIVNAGYVQGNDNGTLTAGSPITRAEVVTVLAGCLEDILDAAEEPVYIYAVMNIPYADFFRTATDADEYVDAVAQATTSKMAGTTGTARGTYNNLEYDEDGEVLTAAEDAKILGVTYPVVMTEETYDAIRDLVPESNADYYFVPEDETAELPEAYFVVTYDETDGYSFTSVEKTLDIDEDLHLWGDAEEAGEDAVLTDSGFGDYFACLIGAYNVQPETGATGATYIGDEEYTIYAVVLTDSTDRSYGLVAIENMWVGTRYTYMELAWSVTGGANLTGHGGVPMQQFSEALNGATLTGFKLYTDKGIIDVACDVALPPYYTGDIEIALTDERSIQITGLPEDADAMVSVSCSVGSGRTAETVYLAQDVKPDENGRITLEEDLAAGIRYTATITMEGYAPVTVTFGDTDMSEDQRARLEELYAEGSELLEELNSAGISYSILEEHVLEAGEALETGTAFDDAAELIEELETYIAEAETLLA